MIKKIFVSVAIGSLFLGTSVHAQSRDEILEKISLLQKVVQLMQQVQFLTERLNILIAQNNAPVFQSIGAAVVEQAPIYVQPTVVIPQPPSPEPVPPPPPPAPTSYAYTCRSRGFYPTLLERGQKDVTEDTMGYDFFYQIDSNVEGYRITSDVPTQNIRFFGPSVVKYRDSSDHNTPERKIKFGREYMDYYECR